MKRFVLNQQTVCPLSVEPHLANLCRFAHSREKKVAKRDHFKTHIGYLSSSYCQRGIPCVELVIWLLGAAAIFLIGLM